MSLDPKQIDLMRRVLSARNPHANIFAGVCTECAKHLPEHLRGCECLQIVNPLTGKTEVIPETQAHEIADLLGRELIELPCDNLDKLCCERPDWPTN